jgi:hypothetical protein
MSAPSYTPTPAAWSNVDPAVHFASDYAKARAKFAAAAASRGSTLESHVHPGARGPAGEALAIDVAVLGDADASGALLLTSGTHGAEGFCGSGCQVALLADDAFVAATRKHGVAVVFVHALNPYGFAYASRTTEENVDLNRNFRTFEAIEPNAAYLAVHDFIVPATWPPAPENEARIGAYVARHGMAALQQAVTSGQCDRADGLFYGGARPAWSNTALRDIMRRHLKHRRRIGWIDFHTGLGPAGHGEKIFAGPDDDAMLARTKAWWGADVTSIWDGSSSSAQLTGTVFRAVLDECPSSEYTGIALEYGTLPLDDVLQALRARQWLVNHPDADERKRNDILRMARDAFYTDTPSWKAMVYAQARVAVFQAFAGLAA